MVSCNDYNIYTNNKRTGMDITGEIVLMREERNKKKKKNFNVTLNEERLDALKARFAEKSPFFEMINKSEQIDFMFYFLEKYMKSSPMFNKVE